jgi:hypothetical protein
MPKVSICFEPSVKTRCSGLDVGLRGGPGQFNMRLFGLHILCIAGVRRDCSHMSDEVRRDHLGSAGGDVLTRLCGPFRCGGGCAGLACDVGITRLGWSGLRRLSRIVLVPASADGILGLMSRRTPAEGWIARRCRPVSRFAAGWFDEMRTRHAHESGGGGQLGILRPGRL